MSCDCWIWPLVLTFCIDLTRASREINITMPGERPTTDDAYLCHGMKLNGQPLYITSFTPIHFPEATHHMILFVCDEPASSDPIWNCGDESTKGICTGSENLIYSWAMDAPGLKLPKDTSFEVGTAGRRHMVLQVHYKDASIFNESPNRRDYSGVQMKVQSHATGRLTGIYLLATGGSIEPFGLSELTTVCEYTGRAVLHPLGLRAHAHSHGVMNELFLGHLGELSLLGQKSPQEPQTFYPINATDQVVTRGDILAARCVMLNKDGRRIYMGNTREDEMCNVYFMYWVNLADRYQLYDTENQNCFSPTGRDDLPGLSDSEDLIAAESNYEFY